MAMSLQRIKGAAIVALAAVIAAYGAGIVSRAAIETVHEEVAPRRDDPRQTTAVPSEHLAGVVRDDEGRPVAGATVVAGQFGGGEPNHRIGTTGSDGRFELTPTGESARLEYIVVHKEALAPASILRVPRDDRAEEGDVILQLSKSVPFVGVVKDGEGKPVAGATARIDYAQYPGSGGPNTRLNLIEPIVLGTPLEHVFRTTTNAQGVFRFADLSGDAKVSLVVTAAGMGEYNTMNRLGPNGEFKLLAGSADAPAEVVLAPGARVVGARHVSVSQHQSEGSQGRHARLARPPWHLGGDQDRRRRSIRIHWPVQGDSQHLSHGPLQ